MKKKLIIIGEILNNLIVIKQLSKRTKQGSRVFLCACSCGKNTKVAAHLLRYNHVRSCGCLQKQAARRSGINNRKEPGRATYISMLGSYKRRAAKRGNEWALSQLQFVKLIQMDCRYCGSPPTLKNKYINQKGQLIYKGITKEWAENQYIRLNGIDRLDNKCGYTEANSVPCCSICNQMKLDRTEEDFMNHTEKILKFRSKSEI